MSFTDKLTLGELKDLDRDMTKDAIKGAFRYSFKSIDTALRFVGECLSKSLEYVGLKEIPDQDPVSTHYVSGPVRVEDRGSHYKGADEWRNGFYVYKDDVLVAFIGHPMWAGFGKVSVITNAQNDSKKVFLI